MVYKRSEYGHQFKVSSLQKNVPVYKENLTYRYTRRERECAHTPIAWDDEVIEDSDTDERLSADLKVDQLPVSDMVVTEESQESEDEVAKEKKLALESDEQKRANVSKETESDVEIVKQNEGLGRQARTKLNKYVTKEMKDNLDKPAVVKRAAETKCLGKTFVKPQQADDDVFVRSAKPKRPDRLNKIPKAKPRSALGVKRPESRADTRSPFVSYGFGASEEHVGDKKTFNVRASSAVHSAALRAQKRNLLAIEKKLEKERTASAREKRKKALFNEKMARETVSWLSEYQRSFPAYENTQYATSDKDPRRQKSYFTT